ncbi:branched-chain amino acid ABC transporter substrate-binding protein [Deinococcus pimensis]|uniref:branched-chain amino acid ABC transporter substrate-binding protein n=1 Tax=Deinococcus pimensis TaxID=309888 RepID=UPI000488ACF7|nr:branched-chain amino acid ABC transporter substrate-binding protein [Deinococcus pimensis]
MHNPLRRSSALSVLTLCGLLTLAHADAQRVVKVATLSPLSGSLESLGNDVRRGAELAVKLRQREFSQLGVTLQLQAFDDEGDAQVGAKQAETILKDDSVLAVVGALNSGVSLTAGGVLAKGQVAMVTPASTADKLTTQGWTHFNRLVAPDKAQAEAGGAYIAGTLKPKSVFVVSDNTTYGNGLSTQIQASLKKSGIKIAAYIGATDVAALEALAPRVQASGADLVFFGGTPDLGGPFVKALRAAGVKATFMGGDALDSSVFVKLAQKDAADTLFTTVYGPVSAFANRTAFVTAYEKEYKTSPSGFAAFAYDAANVLLSGLKSVTTTSKLPTRAQVSAAVRGGKVAADGTITGTVSFTKTGERASSPLFLMRVGADTLAPRVEKVLRYSAPTQP